MDCTPIIQPYPSNIGWPQQFPKTNRESIAFVKSPLSLIDRNVARTVAKTASPVGKRLSSDAIRVAVMLFVLGTCGVRFASAQGVDATGDISRIDCQDGLVLRPGQECAYPGTDERFGVDAAGQGMFLSGAFRGSIDIDSEFDGRRYDIAATDEGGGAWRIERIGDDAAPSASGVPLALRGLDCRGEPSAAGMAIRIEGSVHARTGVASVILSGRVDGELVDVISLGRLSANDTVPFVLRGSASSGLTEFGCAVDVEYFNIGVLRHDPPQRVKWRGGAAR